MTAIQAAYVEARRGAESHSDALVAVARRFGLDPRSVARSLARAEVVDMKARVNAFYR